MRTRRMLIVYCLALLSSGLSAQSAPPMRLTMADAVRLGLKQGLNVVLASSRVEESSGTLMRRQSLLQPKVHVELPVAVQSRSLAAMGISVPGLPLPQVVGPYSTYEARVYGEQALLDFGALHGVRAARQAREAERSSLQDVRQQIVRSVAGLYLNGQTELALCEAAQARVHTGEALAALARAQRDAGVATGIDVLRAQVQLANDRQSLLVEENRYQSALLQLERAIGLTPGTALELAEKLDMRAEPGVQIDAAVVQALNARGDYQAMLRQAHALEEQIHASEARAYPRLSLSGNYGGVGRNPGSIDGTGAIQLSLSMTVFDRDRPGEEAELLAKLRQMQAQIQDLRLGVEQELRQAQLDLLSAASEVQVAAEGLELAQKELDLAQLRFSQGVTNNIEVITAQDGLARAQQNSIVALTHHADARIQLARALGTGLEETQPGR